MPLSIEFSSHPHELRRRGRENSGTYGLKNHSPQKSQSRQLSLKPTRITPSRTRAFARTSSKGGARERRRREPENVSTPLKFDRRVSPFHVAGSKDFEEPPKSLTRERVSLRVPPTHKEVHASKMGVSERRRAFGSI